jgi:hypothetical protein
VRWSDGGECDMVCSGVMESGVVERWGGCGVMLGNKRWV